MKRLLAKAQDALFDARDTVCLERARLITEAWQRHESEPMPLRRALGLEHVLRHMSLDTTSNPLMAGNTSNRPRAWMLVPEHGFGVDGQVALEHDELAGFLDDKVPADLRDYWAGRSFGSTGGGSAGIGHLAIDLERIVNEGLAAIEAKIEASSFGDAVYRHAQAVAIRAVMAWAQRYADVAETAASETDDPELAKAHQRVAVACRHVPARPARNFFEGLQAIALVHLATAIEGHGMSISIGLPDRAMARFSDEVEHAFDRSVDFVCAFLLKISANSYQGRASKTQPVTIGGRDAAGRDVSNAVTLAFLEAFDRTPVSDPHLFLRWHEGLDERVKRRSIAMLSHGRSMPLLVGDDPTIRGFIDAGITRFDAADYCVIGCNELGIPGRACASANSTGGGINYLELLNNVFQTDTSPDIQDMETLWQQYARAMRESIRRGSVNRDQRTRNMAEQVPTPLTSALMRDSHLRGVDLLVDMPYTQRGIFERGLSNAANAFSALQTVVFDQEDLTLEQVAEAMKLNWAGNGESIRRRLLDSPHWANDDDRVDGWVVRLLELRTRILSEIRSELKLPHLLACHVVRSLHHLDGRGIGATPDGRFSGEAVGDSVGGVIGTMHIGPTAVLNSVLKIDAAKHYPGGYNLNLTLPTGVAPHIVRALVEGFFAADGQELQLGMLDAEQLREARRNPGKFRDLIVRVAGLSARFIDLSATEQEELIARAEAAAISVSTLR